MKRATQQALEVTGLCFTIGPFNIVNSFGALLPPGQVLGLIGPNGAGKTTVVDLLSGFLRPAKGSVRVAGRDVTRLPPFSRTRLGLARTFQGSPAIPGLTVLEHLQLAHDITSGARRSNGPGPDELLARFGLADVTDIPANELNTDRRRMLDVARAVMTRPQVLLMDEPFSGLGNEDASRVVREIKNLRASGVAVLVIEHRLALLDNVTNSVIALVAGTPVAHGSMDEVLRNPRVEEAFLGTPIRTREDGDG